MALVHKKNVQEGRDLEEHVRMPDIQYSHD